jgi:hypothetical protein
MAASSVLNIVVHMTTTGGGNWWIAGLTVDRLR